MSSYFKLLRGSKNAAGRNNQGRITSRFRGGRHSRKHRLVGCFNENYGLYLIVSFHYDPFRNVDLALIQHEGTGFIAYVLKAQGMMPGAQIKISFDQKPLYSELLPGAVFFVDSFPLGSSLHYVGNTPYSNGKFGNSAGNFCTLIQKTEDFCFIRLASGKLKKISPKAFGSFGKVGNEKFYLNKLTKAGNRRWLGFRPHVRGVAINPVDHPHGGGEGKSSGGRPSVSPWGWLTKK